MGRKRHALVDSDGRTLEIFLHPTSMQDRDGEPPVINASKVFSDAAYQGRGRITFGRFMVTAYMQDFVINIIV